jgi:hypothetical protein
MVGRLSAAYDRFNSRADYSFRVILRGGVVTGSIRYMIIYCASDGRGLSSAATRYSARRSQYRDYRMSERW